MEVRQGGGGGGVEEGCVSVCVLFSPVRIVPHAVEPEHLLVVVEVLPQGVQGLVRSEWLHCLEHLPQDQASRKVCNGVYWTRLRPALLTLVRCVVWGSSGTSLDEGTLTPSLRKKFSVNLSQPLGGGGEGLKRRFEQTKLLLDAHTWSV